MNSSSLMVSTRFAPPRIGSHAVAREHLLDKLQEGNHSRLMLITGAAGFGKTTLLAQWRQCLLKEGAQITWLSLSAEDGSLETFCYNLLGSLQQADLALDESLLLTAPEGGGGVQVIASLLINALARVPAELYLLIDDFHHATDERIGQMIQALIEGAPHNLHVVLASRTTPPLLLGRLRAMGELCEVECAQLSFDFRESLAFLKAYLDEEVDLDTAHAIHDLTDGWPIGLQLLSIALKGNLKQLVKGSLVLPDRVGLAAYLSEDVLAGLPTEMLEFLQKISILRRFNAQVASHVTGMPQAAELIAAVEERNLFIQPVDQQGKYQWYRLHPLFAEFLGQRLLCSQVPMADLHRRATDWFEQAGLVSEALRHALLCEDFEVVVQLLGRVQPSYRNISHLNQFMCWLEQVPLNVLTQHPPLLLMGIWGAVLTLWTDKAQAWIGALETVAQAAQWSSQLRLLEASIAIQRDDVVGCLALLEKIDRPALGNPFHEQVHCGLHIGCLALMGRHTEGRHLFNHQGARHLRAGTDEMVLLYIATVANAAMLEGKVLDAERIGKPGLLQAEAVHGRRSVSACSSAAVMAEVYYELDRTDDAREALANRLDILRFSAPGYMIVAALCCARLQCLQVSPRVALEYLEQKVEHFHAVGLKRGIANMLAEQLRILLLCGDWRHAESVQVLLDDLARNHRGATPCDAEIMTLAALSSARLALARQQPEAALQALSIVERHARDLGRIRWNVQVDLLKAFALSALERDGEAQESMRAAVLCGYRLGLVRTLLDEGEAFQVMLKRLGLENDPVLGDYCQTLLLQPSVPVVEPAPVPAGAGQVVQLLTRREQDILELLEQSMSNKRIALTLNLSLQTVKWNLKNIFVKLQVSSRYDAIVAAKKARGADH